MGVPKFFKWLTDNYPKTIFFEPGMYVQNLYIDANCAIHPCCHPSENPPKNEEEMMKRVCDYLLKLIDVVKPTDTVYIAIDGVAPVAKMVQQRMRRFKAIKEKQMKNKILEDNNHPVLPDSWDHNAITPGTSFMYELNKRISSFFKNNSEKISAKKIILSDSSVPGEGEHKVMNYIRENNLQNEINCIYGLDADLIMLALTLNSSNAYLLRETQQFYKTPNSDYPFQYLNIGILRNAFNEEFRRLIGDDVFSIENCIDDFVMMCFLLGNDFLPSLPSLKINKKGLDILLDLYCDLFKTHREYLTSNEYINKIPFQRFLEKISEREEEDLLKIYNNNYVKKISVDPSDPKALLDSMQIVNDKYIDKIRLGQPGYRDRFYYNYFKISPPENDFKKSIKVISQNYFDGLAWTLKYYKKGCSDWNWCYQYHQAPLSSDFVKTYDKLNFSKIVVEGKPVKPFTQLMSVLPPESSHLIPSNLAENMIDNESLIIDLFPTDYQLDYMGKRFLWECHPILTIPDVSRINKVVDSTIFSKGDGLRNKHGKDKVIKDA